jgi:hypothetical protein
MSDEKPDEKPETRNGKLKASAAVLAVTAVGKLTAWRSYSFAPEWFADASREAKDERRGDLEVRGARRREILFAVCAAESYVFEWVRDTVLNRDFEKLKKYFPPIPPGKKRGVLEKLRDIPKDLAADDLVPAPLDCGAQEWSDFREAVEYRDGLVHAAASRPETDDQPESEKPVPAMDVLDALPPGWAVERVRVILRKLHSDTKTPLPDWLSS